MADDDGEGWVSRSSVILVVCCAALALTPLVSPATPSALIATATAVSALAFAALLRRPERQPRHPVLVELALITTASTSISTTLTTAALDAPPTSWPAVLGTIATGLTGGLSAITAAKLAEPLLGRPATRKIGVMLLACLGVVVTTILLITLQRQGRPVTSATYALGGLATGGMGAWGALVVVARRISPSRSLGTEWIGVHLLGWTRMAAILVMHLLSAHTIDLVVAPITLAILAASLKTGLPVMPIQRLTRRRLSLVYVVAPAMTLLAPMTGWMYLNSDRATWLGGTAFGGLTLALVGGLVTMSSRTAESSIDGASPNPLYPEDLRLHFQPIVRASDSKVVGAEALLRLVGSDGIGRSAPGLVAELGTGPQRADVTDFVLTQAFRQGTMLLESLDDPDAFVTLNLSAAELGNPEVADRIERALSMADCSPDGFGIELTEAATLGVDSANVFATLRSLQDSGFLILLDDFGTGQSNLAALGEFEFDIVKIDQSLLRGAESPRGEQVLRRSIELARSTGTRVIVEGIESQSDIDLVRRNDVDFAQGFALGRPVLAADVMTRGRP